ncbi:MAG: hypothetical protein AAF547_17440 [Actinomycetota bacterium]
MFRFLPLIAGLLFVAAVGKRRRMVSRLSGKTPSEVRAIVHAKAASRTGSEKADAIADRVVAKLEARGVLAPEPVA